MPSKGSHRGEPALKRARLEKNPKGTRRFTSADEIRASLRTQNQDALVEGLTALRNQLTVKFGEPSIAPQDERLVLVQQWLEAVPGAYDIFEVWESTNQRQTSLLSLIIAVLSSLLTLLSSHYTFQSLGQPIIKALLTPPWIRRLNTYIGGSHAELILVTLKLFTGMNSFAGGRERKSVLAAFAWETKSLPKLLNMRRRSNNEYIDPLIRPDIRTLYVLFILSFVDSDCPIQVKTTFLEQHRDAFLSIFKGLGDDPYTVARKVLEICWAGIWSDSKVKRTLKISLFNEMTISQMSKLYDRIISNDEDPDHIPADLVHHFLLAICTRPGAGICFKDRGWYPRDSDGGDRNENEEDEPSRQNGGKIYNKILANVLRTLKVNEDSRQQELALKIMAACPELVAGYWPRAALTLEPRLSSKWIANISFFGSIISLPVPSSSFLLLNSTIYQPSPPPMSNIVENILPSVNTKLNFSKGLQSSSSLVQHCTALALAKCLVKYEEVMSLFQKVESTLEEDSEDGQWCKVRKDVQREVRRRVPDFQVVVAFSQQKFGDAPSLPGQTAPQPNSTKAALLSESAQRLLWMYHRCLPSLVAEARFDVGKLLQNFSNRKTEKDVPEGDEPLDAPARFHVVRQLHTLRLLKESEQFIWAGKAASSSHSNLYVLLKTYTTSEVSAIRVALTSLLQHLLSESIIFQEDPDEPSLWLASLPSTRRAAGAEAPDGAPLTDEGESVVVFLDDCVQRCLKTPYRYIEELYALNSENKDHLEHVQRPDTYPSPLLMTIFEQLNAKVVGKLLSPSDILALASFVRKLVFKLSSKQQDLWFLRAFAAKVDAVLQSDRLFSQYPNITSGIRREMIILHACLMHLQKPITPQTGTDSVVHTFLDQIENLPIPGSKNARTIAAFELVDWLRLVNQPLNPAGIHRLAAVIGRFHKPALKEFSEHLHPGDGLLWQGLNVLGRFPDLRNQLTFECLFLHSNEVQIMDPASRNVLVESVFTRPAPALAEMKRVLWLITHGIPLHEGASKGRDQLTQGLLLLLASVMKRASSSCSPTDFIALKEYIFSRSNVVRGLLTSTWLTDDAHSEIGLRQLVEVSLEPGNESDIHLVTDITSHWSDVLKLDLKAQTQIHVASAEIWIKYLSTEALFDLLDTLTATVGSTPSTPVLHLLRAILAALRKSTGSDDACESVLHERLQQLLVFRGNLKDSVLEDMISIALDACFPMCYGGDPFLPVDTGKDDLASMIHHSDARWLRRLALLPVELDLQSFVTQESWTKYTVKIISRQLYRRSYSAKVFCQWLGTDCYTRHSTLHIALVLHAFLDSARTHNEVISDADHETWFRHFVLLSKIVVDNRQDQKLRSICASCISLILELVPSSVSRCLDLLATEVQSRPIESLTLEVLVIGNRLHAKAPTNATNWLNTLADLGLQWAVRCFAGPSDQKDHLMSTIEELTSVIKNVSSVKTHLVETVMTTVVQNRFTNTGALDLVTTLVQAVPMKPLIINRHLQSIVQHHQFFKVCAVPGPSPSRDAIVNLLHVLFHLHPTNTCQATHVEPLVRIYQGTLSKSDRKLLSIFQLFETHRKVSIASLLSRWSSSPDVTSTTVLEAVQGLNASLVLRTFLNFPKWRRLEAQIAEREISDDAQLYDPVFLTLIFAHMLSTSPPSSAFSWVEVFRTNVVSLLIRSTSSKDHRIREVALHQIAALWKHLETADMQEKPHVTYILNLLKDVIPPPSDGPPRRLPAYTTLILSHALRGIFYPSNFMYPHTARFLLQRPELDTKDVPMLYGMLYSSSDDWKKERGWIIRFLSDGMTSTEDWRVLKRRHTWDLLASLFQSSEKDHALRNGIFEVLANLTCNRQATTSLILKSSLLSWIELQLLNSWEDEAMEWLKILENIITVVDPMKLESSTSGAWRSVICRCLSLLLTERRSSTTLPVLMLAARVILRLSLLPGPLIPQSPSLISQAVKHLKRLEETLHLPYTLTKSTLDEAILPLPPHSAQGLRESHPLPNSLRMWGESVETLWRVTMTFREKTWTWDVLTSRLLVWRSIVGEGGSPIGDWARREVVRSLRTTERDGYYSIRTLEYD